MSSLRGGRCEAPSPLYFPQHRYNVTTLQRYRGSLLVLVLLADVLLVLGQFALADVGQAVVLVVL